MRVPEFSKGLIDFVRASEMAQESADQHQILYINRTGEDGVLVCSFQMGKTYMNLEEAAILLTRQSHTKPWQGGFTEDTRLWEKTSPISVQITFTCQFFLQKT